MIKFAAAFAVASGLLGMPFSVTATQLTFDDIDASAGDVAFNPVQPYQGFRFTGLSVYATVEGFPGFNNGIVSQANAAYGNELVTINGTPSADTTGIFDFSSAFIGAGYLDNLTVTFDGLLEGKTLYSRDFNANASDPAVVRNFNFTGIDTLLIKATRTATTSDPFACEGSDCSFFTVDNVVLTAINGTFPQQPVQVPEPATALLAAIALAVMAWVRRRT